jgi:DNA-binding CsgD family transcriptional regulator
MKDYDAMIRRYAIRYYYLTKYISEKIAGVPLNVELDDFIQEAKSAEVKNLNKNSHSTLEGFQVALFRNVEDHCKFILADNLGLPVEAAEGLIKQIQSVISNSDGVSSSALWIPDDMFIPLASKKYPAFIPSIRDIRQRVETKVSEAQRKIFENSQGPSYQIPHDMLALYEELRRQVKTLSEREEEVLYWSFGFKDGRNHTRKDIGKKYHLSERQVRKIQAYALRKLRHPDRIRLLFNMMGLEPEEPLLLSYEEHYPELFIRGDNPKEVASLNRLKYEEAIEGRIDLSKKKEKLLLDRLQELTNFSKADKKILAFVLQGSSAMQIAKRIKGDDLDKIERRREDIIKNLRFIFTLGMLEDFGSRRQVQELLIRLTSDQAQVSLQQQPESDRAMGVSKTGGIDLTPANISVEVKKEIASSLEGTPRNDTTEGIKFHMDPAMLAQLQNAPGFVPVIIHIQPLKNLSDFLSSNQITA